MCKWMGGLFLLLSLSYADIHQDASAFYEQKKYTEAITLLEQYLTEHPQDANTLFDLSLSYWELRSLSENNLLNANYYAVKAYLLEPMDGDIKTHLNNIQNVTSSAAITKTISSYKILFMRYFLVILSVLLLILSFCCWKTSQGKLTFKQLLVIALLLFGLAGTLYWKKTSVVDSTQKLIFIKSILAPQTTTETPVPPPYSLGDCFFVNNENDKQVAFYYGDNVYWVDKTDVVTINKDEIWQTVAFFH